MMDDVLTELRLATESIDRLYDTQRRWNTAREADIGALWNAIECYSDDLHAVANRLEALTRANGALACNPDESAGVRDADS